MTTNPNSTDLLPILEEFTGKRCILKLITGKLITGILGNVQGNSTAMPTETTKVCIFENDNINTFIQLHQIFALRLE
ncbi:MAG: hypothetical protein WCG93_01190 [Paludibacter sp.]